MNEFKEASKTLIISGTVMMAVLIIAIVAI